MSTARHEIDSDRLRGLVHNLGVVFWAADARTRELTFVSGYVEQLLGHPVRRWLEEPGFWDSVVHPDDRDRSQRERWHRSGDQDDYDLSYRALTAGGEVVWLHEKVHVERDGAGAPRVLQGVLLDVTGQRVAAERERFLAVLDRESQKLDDADDLMALATRMLGEHLAVDRCAYARTEEDENHFVMSGDHATGLPPLPGRFAMREFGVGALRAMRAGEPWVVMDSGDDPRLDEDDLAAYAVTGIRAVICLPLLRGGRFVAAMAVHQAQPRQWTQDEIDLVSVVVNRCWESMQRAHSDRALRDNEQRLRLLIDRAVDCIWVLDGERRFVEINPAACRLLGYRREDLIGRGGEELFVLGDDGRELPHDQEQTDVWNLRCADGSIVALELSVQVTPGGLQAIGRDVTERQRTEAERELLLQREHEIATTLQRSLLPRELPVLERLATSARYLPASSHAQIGGDWYEVLPISGTVAGMSVGDVVGSGPTAAAVMGQLRSALAGFLVDGHSPAAALERLDAFASRVNGATGSTCACITFDWATGRLCWASAGHLPPLVADEQGARLLTNNTGAVLGTPGRARYEEHSTALAPGATIVLYTDGLVERRGVVVDEGLGQLLAVVAQAHHQAPAELTGTIVDALLAYGHSDDVALVVARHLPAPLRVTSPAESHRLSELRGAVSEWAAAAGLSDDLAYDLVLACGEAAANVVDHAYPGTTGTFDTELSHTDGVVHVTVRDRGRWRPAPEDPGHRGRGLQMIRAMADDVELDASGTGTTVSFRFSTAPADVPPAPAPKLARPSDVIGLAAQEAPDGTQVLRLTGDLDTHTSGGLRAPLLAHLGARPQGLVDIDLTRLGYLSSSGVALLLEAADAVRRAGRTISVTCLPGSAPDRILTLSGLRDVLAVSSRSEEFT
ncbi:SpoIIE family protein phosphatase [Lentzea sp. BCCO 10_0798]|uniref:SpoIIE family protein phosphatase n=1 Tax=Lentzea kristufekii TaxID=3095430 RepID=A0ABU4TRF4_9PSEU|nr:SpoIIE family protein phosphatase [Lentzea sp. BCCO 10_0798]MDX8050860.1 SpoIIE family protein phosphatase [Lentzea sp. BCCO 10_0798]